MKQYGLIGFPLSHSFSKTFFTAKFEQLGLTDCVYDLFPLTSIEELPTLLNTHPNLCGLNVTIPYKEAVLPYLDEMDETARKVGAVNTIRIVEQNGKRMLQGFNTDVYGFRQSIKPFFATVHGRALVLGAGGAAKAVTYALQELGVDCLSISRNPSGETSFAYANVNQYMLQACKLVVNCTPLGMSPDTTSFPPIPYEFLDHDHLLVDLVYNPAETEFMKRGKAHGAVVLNGLDMLKFQAEKAWEIWTASV